MTGDIATSIMGKQDVPHPRVPHPLAAANTAKAPPHLTAYPRSVSQPMALSQDGASSEEDDSISELDDGRSDSSDRDSLADRGTLVHPAHMPQHYASCQAQGSRNGIAPAMDLERIMLTVEQIEPVIEAGPRWKMEGFLEAMDRLLEAWEVLGQETKEEKKQEEGEKGGWELAYAEADGLLGVALGHLEEEFADALEKNSKPFDPATLTPAPPSPSSSSQSDSSLLVATKSVPLSRLAHSSCSSSPNHSRERSKSIGLLDDPMLWEIERESRERKAGASFGDEMPSFSSFASSGCQSEAESMETPGMGLPRSQSERPAGERDSPPPSSAAASPAATASLSSPSSSPISLPFSPTEGEGAVPRPSSVPSLTRLSSAAGGAASPSPPPSSPLRRQASASTSGQPSRPPLPRSVRKPSMDSGRLGRTSSGGSLLGEGLVPVSALPWLKKMADRMVKGGGGERCLRQFCKIRAEILTQSVKRLEMVELRVSALDAMPWATLEGCIKAWVRDAHVLVLVLLDSERRLLSLLFGPLFPPSELSSALSALLKSAHFHRALMLLLLNGRALSKSTKSPEKLFGLCEMWAMAADVDRHVREALVTMKKELILEEWGSMLTDVAHGIFLTFDELKRRVREAGEDAADAAAAAGSQDASPRSRVMNLKRRFKLPQKLSWRVMSEQTTQQEVDPEGRVHALTSYVVNYIRQYMDDNGRVCCPDILGRVFSEFTDHEGNKRLLEEETGAVLEALRCSLEAKAKTCSNAILRALFLLNNGNYIFKCMPYSSVKDAVRWQEQLEKYKQDFQDALLAKVSFSLGPSMQQAGMEHGEVKSRLRKFNSAFEELALEQRQWAIGSSECRKSMRLRIAQVIKEAYSQFLTPHREELCTMSSYHWTPDGIERIVLKSFFLNQGIPVTASV